MMKDEMEPFAERLRQQPLKAIPIAWRAEILAGARDRRVASPALRHTPRSRLSTINQQLASIFWPHPKAWGALAAVWIFIFFLNLSLAEKPPVVAKKYSPPAPDAVAELRQQRLLFAELMGSTPAHDADRKPFLAKPRSERVSVLTG